MKRKLCESCYFAVDDFFVLFHANSFFYTNFHSMFDIDNFSSLTTFILLKWIYQFPFCHIPFFIIHWWFYMCNSDRLKIEKADDSQSENKGKKQVSTKNNEVNHHQPFQVGQKNRQINFISRIFHINKEKFSFNFHFMCIVGHHFFACLLRINFHPYIVFLSLIGEILSLSGYFT